MTDLADVERTIYKAEKHFGQSIRGVLHLAGAGNVSEHFQQADNIHWLIRQKRILQVNCQGKRTERLSCRKPSSMIRQYHSSFWISKWLFWRYNIRGLLCGQ
ncbi:hypothetical protein ACEQPO_02565 [Bacillus sp. SL00103]